MRRTGHTQAHVKDISKDVFAKFKKVRELHSDLYGHYQLFSKNGLKYVGKQLSSSFQLSTTRNPLCPIFRYSAG